MSHKTIKIKIGIQNFKAIHTLCKELGIDATQYEMIDNELAGKIEKKV